MKSGVNHRQRFEDALSKKLVECLPGSDFNQPTQYIYRKTVIPRRAGLMHQRRFAHALNGFFDSNVRAGDAEFRIHQITFFITRSLIIQTRSVAQQITNCHLALCGHDFITARSCRRVFFVNSDFQSAHFRQVFCDRIVERKFALFIQHHNRYACDGFSH